MALYSSLKHPKRNSTAYAHSRDNQELYCLNFAEIPQVKMTEIQLLEIHFLSIPLSTPKINYNTLVTFTIS
jgi:hypothetical protein